MPEPSLWQQQPWQVAGSRIPATQATVLLQLERMSQQHTLSSSLGLGGKRSAKDALVGSG